MSKKEHICEWCFSCLSTKWSLERHQLTAKCMKSRGEKIQNTKIINNINPILRATENKGEIIYPIVNGDENKVISTINKNNIVNILKFSPDLSRENIKKIVKLINPKTIMNENGIAEFYEKYIARNENGECGMITINKSSEIFFFLDENKNLCQKTGKFITKCFNEYAEDEIKINLKLVKEIVVDPIDYGEICKNIRNKVKLRKDIGELMYIGDPDFQAIKKNENIVEKEDHPELIKLKDEREKLRIIREQLKYGTFDKNTIEVKDIDEKLIMKNIDKTKKYSKNEKRYMKIWINGKRIDDVFSTPDIERNNYIELVRTQIMNNNKIDNKYEIRELNKKIRDFNYKWYMEKRINMEMKEEIKNEKLKKKKERDSDEEVRKLNLREMYELQDEKEN